MALCQHVCALCKWSNFQTFIRGSSDKLVTKRHNSVNFRNVKNVNIGFVRNLIGHTHWNFYEDDVIIVTSRVHRTQSVSAVFCLFFHHLPSVTVKRHRTLRLPEKMNAFTNETRLNVKHQPFIFQHIVQIYLNTYWYTLVIPRMSNVTAAIAASVVEATRRPGLFSSTTFSPPQGNFSHQTCIAGLVKHLSPYTGRISEWIFGQSPFAHRKWITECCSFHVMLSAVVSMSMLYTLLNKKFSE